MTAVDRSVFNQPIRAVLWVIFGMILFSLQDVVIKWVSDTYPLYEVIFFRTLFGLTVTVGIAHLEGGIGLLKTRRLRLHMVRGLLIVFCNTTYFAALATMPLAETMAIFFVAPIFITALSGPVLGERVGWLRWLAVVVGMIGVMLMVRPSTDTFDWVALLPLMAAFGYAVTQILTRPLGRTDRASAMSFYIQLTLLVFSVLMGLTIGDGTFSGSGNANLEFLVRAWVLPTSTDVGFFALSGLIIAVAAFAISQAYILAPATTVAPFEYLALPFAVLWGFLVWGDFPDAWTFVGIALIIGAGVFIVYRERVRKKAEAAYSVPDNL